MGSTQGLLVFVPSGPCISDFSCNPPCPAQTHRCYYLTNMAPTLCRVPVPMLPPPPLSTQEPANEKLPGQIG